MIKDRRFLLTFDNEPSMADRLGTFLGPYDCRAYSSNGGYVDFGAGSLGAIDRLTMLDAPPGFTGCFGSVGRWCEVAATAEIMGRGAHANDLPVNVGLAVLKPFSKAPFGLGMLPFTPVKIGNGVVISSGARIMPGVSVGDGAVVGANAVVTHDVAPYSIVAGAPARALSKRLEFAPWWDFSVEYLRANLGDIQSVAAQPGPHQWRTERPRFVLQNLGRGYIVSGFTDGEDVRPLSEAPSQVRAYISQALTPGTREIYWVPDCWDD